MAMEEAGIAFPKSYVFEGEVDYRSGEALARRIAKERPEVTEVVVTSDVQAIGAIKGFHDSGLTVPGDISVIGFDNLEISCYTVPGLTTVGQDITRKGERIVELLVENMDNPSMEKHEEILPVSVIERGSVRACIE